MKIRMHIPNAITLLNLFSGSLAAWYVMQGKADAAALMLAMALVFDFFDGLVARTLKVKSEIGKELDSLADVVSFGLVPGLMMLLLMMQSGNIPSDPTPGLSLFALPGLLLPLFAALRLARFNLDTTQHTNFKGLPVPAAAILIAGTYLANGSAGDRGIARLVEAFCSNYWLLLLFTIAVCALMVSRLPMLSLKFSKTLNKETYFRIAIVLTAAMMLIAWGLAALPLVMVAYILLSLAWGLTNR